jgi:hypothetical protein
MSSCEQAVMCVLMLRGPQTPGELKQRGERIHTFDGLREVHATLGGLIERGLVVRLDRRPGQKEERYEQLLGEDAEPHGGSGGGPPEPTGAPAHGNAPIAPSAPGLSERVARLERELTDLRAELAEFRAGGGGESRPAYQLGSSEGPVEHCSSARLVEHGSSERLVEPVAPEPQSVGAGWRSESAPTP